MSMLKAGDKAPEFTLRDHGGDEVTLSNLLHVGPIVLYFYPADFTPVCTKEACMIRDLSDELATVGLQVIGISPDNEDSHRRFKEKHDLGFTLLSDPEKHVIKMFGVDGPFGVGVRRATYLIDQNRRIQSALCADLFVGKHEDFLRKAVVLREAARGNKT